MDTRLHRIADLLLAIEMEMRHLELWETKQPSAQDLASLMPFCHDTLEFSQWLQWVFLPRMKDILEQDDILPNQSEITPLAEHSFLRLEVDTDKLLALLSDMDQQLNQNP